MTIPSLDFNGLVLTIKELSIGARIEDLLPSFLLYSIFDEDLKNILI
jgi:hypothetical protein